MYSFIFLPFTIFIFCNYLFKILFSLSFPCSFFRILIRILRILIFFSISSPVFFVLFFTSIIMSFLRNPLFFYILLFPFSFARVFLSRVSFFSPSTTLPSCLQCHSLMSTTSKRHLVATIKGNYYKGIADMQWCVFQANTISLKCPALLLKGCYIHCIILLSWRSLHDQMTQRAMLSVVLNSW